MNKAFHMPTPQASRHANKGAGAETAVYKTLMDWQKSAPGREANRLVDTKAAGRIIKAAAADFEFFTHGLHGLIEAKETEHDYRLPHPRLTQWPRFLRRFRVGGLCILLVYHTRAKVWRSVAMDWLIAQREASQEKSWDFRHCKAYPSASAALEGVAPGVF